MSVDAVFPYQDAPRPLIVSFENEAGADFVSRVSECRLLRRPTTGKSSTAVVVVNGRLYDGVESSDFAAKNYIVARNRRTGKVRVYEVARALLKASLPEEVDRGTTTTDGSGQLGEKFGSKRRKRAVEQWRKSTVDVDAMKDKLEAIVVKTELGAEDALNVSKPETSRDSEYAPPADESASEPHRVYRLENIFSEEELCILRTNADSLFEDVPSCELGEYVSGVVTRDRKRSDRMAAALVADCLVWRANQRSATKTGKTCTFSDTVESWFDRNIPWGDVRSKDKAICHAIVMLLIACDCTIPDFDELKKALSVTAAKLNQMVKVVGARTVKGGGGTSVVLKLPLVPPPKIRGEARGKKS